jgi:hypothetical protein
VEPAAYRGDGRFSVRRRGLAIALFVIAPLVAEFLLGNLSITALPALLVLAPLYGGGALLVRESARRADRGWPTLLLLGLAYGVVEEGLATQSLFNPDYLRLQMHLLDPAHVAALGMGVWWTVFVLTLHVVWSVGVSIALVEALARDEPRTPWLGRLGLVVAGALFVLGAFATAQFTLRGDPFVASVPQLASTVVVSALLVGAAFSWPRWREGREAGSVPSPWLVGGIGLVAGSIFLVIPPAWGWWAVATYLGLGASAVVAAVIWSRRAAWGRLHELALAGGGALAYAWHAFLQQPVVGDKGAVARVGNAIFALALLALLAAGARRAANASAASR